MRWRTLLHVLPADWRAALRSLLRELSLRTALLLLPLLGARRILLNLAVYGWNNRGFVPDLDYLLITCAQARRAQRGILECGSGLSTIMLGIFSRVPVISLEHIEEWADLVNKRLRQFGMPNRASYAPLAKRQDFDWYSCVISGEIDLVICDGPPSSIRGGRYGLLPGLRQLAFTGMPHLDGRSGPRGRTAPRPAVVRGVRVRSAGNARLRSFADAPAGPYQLRSSGLLSMHGNPAGVDLNFVLCQDLHITAAPLIPASALPS